MFVLAYLYMSCRPPRAPDRHGWDRHSDGWCHRLVGTGANTRPGRPHHNPWTLQRND